MDIQGLKDKILQLAIQGKLVEQDENDEPVSALVQRIEEERDKLVKEGKIRKEKPLPEITDEEKPFEIPESWEWVRLGEIALVNMGQSPKGDSVNDNEGMEFHQGKVYFGDRYLNKSDKYTTSPNKIAQPGDILLSVRAPVGAINITDREVCIGRGLCAISGLGYKRNDYYFYVILALKKYLIERATGTTFLAVTVSTVNEMLIPLPPLVEQKRIVEKVDELFALIDELNSNKEDLLEVINLTRNQVLQEAIQGKLVEQNPEDEPASLLLERIKEERDKLVKEGKIRKEKPLPEITEEEKPFEIPEGWEWVRLGDITRICLGLTHRPEYVERGIPFLSVKDISSGSISFSNCRFIEVSKYNSLPEGSKPQKGDVLFGRVGTLGVPSIVDVDFPFGIFVSLGFLRPYIINMNIYLKTFMETKLFFDQVYSNVFGSAQINLNTGWLSNFLVPLPPLAEQKRIVEKVDMIMEILDKLENELTTKI